MEKIAIIGLSCLFPDAKTPEEFWQNIVGQKDSISLATVEEIGVEPTIFYDPVKGKIDKLYSMQGGYIRNFKLDPTGYNLPSELIEGLDPLFKGSLYVAKQALQHSNYLEDERVLSRCGVILGNLSLPTKFSYQLFAPIYQQSIEPVIRELLQNANFRLPNLPGSAKVSPYNAMISGLPTALVARAFSLSGINFALDSACSSSLCAVKLACHYLSSHKADLMLAGAISYSDTLTVQAGFCNMHAYPENGISRPLDKSSKGLIPAEGIGMVVLKRYSDAIRDRDQIYATICGNGLSNDGRGRHLLSPNPQGQILAFERAYAEAGISPRDIDYLECHATGTLLGDQIELSSTDSFFGKHKAAPLVGAVKSNVGHLLTASGVVSIIKVILSMSKGVIPPTINITEPLNSQNNVIAAEQIVRAATPWPNNGPLKRAAISCFGFGGNNAHLIVEQPGKVKQIPDADEGFEPVETTKMAIVGMDTFFGSCDGLDAFERSIYEGNQHFIGLPTDRWKGIEEQEKLLKSYGFEGGEAPLGAYIKDIDIDTLHFKIPPNEAEKITPQQLLILKVADRALRNAGLSEGGNVAVIVAMETDLSIHRPQQRANLSWQLKEGLISAGISLPSEQIAELETIVKDSLNEPVQLSGFLGSLGNIMTSRISALWNFTGPSFTLSAGENSVFKALEVAQMLLAAGEVDAVVVGAVDIAGGVENVLLRNQLAKINTGVNTLSYDRNTNGWIVGEGAGAVILKRLDTAKQEQDRIYAVIDAISLVEEGAKEVNNFPQPPVALAVTQACQKAFTEAGMKPVDIGYVEVFGSGVAQEDAAEIAGLNVAYQTPKPELTCAIGSVKANIGHTYAASGMASLIKTALCLYHRYIPATPQWSGPKKPEVWQGSPFYVATESRAWFLEAGASKRVAAINGLGLDGTYAHLILSEESSQRDRKNRYLEQIPFYLFPLAADDRSALLEQIGALQQTIEDCSSLSAAASLTFAAFQKRQKATYALAILGRNKDELTREIQRALKGVANAFDKGEDWQTPVGSYFTAKPLGKRGSIAFVYPGAFNSYIGLGRNIPRLFPKFYDDVDNYVTNIGSRIREKLLYPRSLNSLSKRQLEILEQQLIDNPLAMLESGIGFAWIFNIIMRDYFQVQPQCAFGYSLGEISMLCGQGVWSSFNQGSDALNSSPLFGTRLSGPKNAVREYWGLPRGQNHESGEIWSNYVLIAPVSQVREYLKHENRVYLTIVNTPKEVVIAGEPQACQRVIKHLNCDAFRVPADNVIHCEIMSSEYHELSKLNTLPIQKVPDTVFYSAAEYKPIAIDSHSIGHNLAKGLCQQLDFPRLINRVYEDGTRIFVEAGAGSTCTRWIGENLKHKEHLTVSLNKRGIDDHTSLVRVLAKLLSHRVSLDLSLLYSQAQESVSHKSMPRTITLGGCRINSTILSDKNKEIFKDISSSSLIQDTKIQSPIETSAQSIIENSFAAREKLRSYDGITTKEAHQQFPTPSTATHRLVHVDMPDLRNPQYQKLSENTSRVTKAHAAFLQARQESLQEISEIIQLQLAFSERLLNQKLEE